MDDKRTKILNGVLTIPSDSIARYISKGDVSKSEVFDKLNSLSSSKSEDKKKDIEEKLRKLDDEEWTKATTLDTVDSYRHYCDILSDGLHSQECETKLGQLDDQVWTEVGNNPSHVTLAQYKALFPTGKHITECESLLNDLPWLTVKSKKPSPTIDDYRDYMSKYPGKHDREANDAIKDLEDENDWHNAEIADTSYAYKQYLEKHPNGKYANKAHNATASSAERDQILDELKKDRNSYTAKELNDYIGNHVLSEADLRTVFADSNEVEAIRKYKEPKELPDGKAPESLQAGSTEVYFWGTPSSGKTCALGAILSAAKKYGILHKKKCQGHNYMDLLCNIFVSDSICVLPQGTSDGSIQEMVFSLRDNKNNEHTITFIDLAGEVFRAMYKKENNIQEDSYVREQALNKTLDYLRDGTNKKIHFFIVAYGEEHKKWDDLYMSDYLETTMEYLNNNKVIRKGTNGVYILVTKSDNMPCKPEERAEYADRYIKEEMPAFYNNVKSICKHAGVRDFEVLPFSVGNVFAQKLCHFESDNTDSVLDKLILKSEAPHSGFFGSIFNWLANS